MATLSNFHWMRRLRNGIIEEYSSFEVHRRAGFDENAAMLRDLFGCKIERDDAKEAIQVEVELACRLIGNKYGYASECFKRQLMSYLRGREFDAGEFNMPLQFHRSFSVVL